MAEIVLCPHSDVWHLVGVSTAPTSVSVRPRPDISSSSHPADNTYAVEPTDIIPSTLTHIVYAFADVSPDTGSISLTDSYADEQVGGTAIVCMTGLMVRRRNISPETRGTKLATTSTDASSRCDGSCYVYCGPVDSPHITCVP